MSTVQHETPGSDAHRQHAERSGAMTNGAAMAAFLAAGIGSFAMGAILVLGELGILSVPALYAPAGGVSGRTTLAIVVWIIAWVVLHRRWSSGQVGAARIALLAFVLILLGLLGSFPPLWELL